MPLASAPAPQATVDLSARDPCVDHSAKMEGLVLHHICVAALLALSALTAKTFYALAGVAWEVRVWAWKGAGVDVVTPVPPAPRPCVTLRAVMGELVPALECALALRVFPASGVLTGSANTCPNRWPTPGATRRWCHNECRHTVEPGAGRAALPSDRSTRQSRKSSTALSTPASPPHNPFTLTPSVFTLTPLTLNHSLI